MNRIKGVFWFPLAFALTCAQAFRDDLPSDPVLDCVPPAIAVSPQYREACALAAIDRACTTDRALSVRDIATALGVTTGQVQKAIGRHVLASLDRGDLCARSEGERRQVLAASMVPRKVQSESPKEWLLSTLGGPDGEIDHAAVSRAIEQREVIVAGSLSLSKRGGLPAAPVGWTNLTGYTQSPGRINHIQFLDGTGNNFLAGADGGGIWRTSDGGTTWAPVNDFLGSLSITNFAMATNDAGTIYAGTNQSGSHTYFPFGIVKSVDGGLTWSQLPQTSPGANADFTYVNRIAVHPTNSSIVLAATNGGAYQSIDGGASWTKVGAINTRSNYVAFHPSNGNLRAVSYHDGTVRYTTTGDLMGAGAATATVLAGGPYMKLAYARSDVNRMYALVTDPSTFATRLRMSTTGGASWTDIPTLPTSIVFNNSYLFYTGGLWVDPLNANRVAVCEGWAGFTTDVTAVAPVWKALYSGWVDFHGIVEHPGYNGAGNRTVFFMDDGGLYRVNDIDILDTNPSPFTQFARIDTGMTVTEVYSVSGHGGNPILGAQDVAPKAYRTDPSIPDATLKWRFLKRPPTDASCPNCSWIGDGATTAASTANPLVLYGSRQYLDMIRSNDGGATAISIVTGSALNEGGGASNTNAAFIAPFVLDPSNQSRMLAGGRSLWRSTNADTGTPPTWTAIRAPYTETACGSSYVAPIAVIAIAPTNPDIVWIAHACAGRVFKSLNATQAVPTWTEVTTLPSAANLRSKSSIMIDQADPNIVWIGLGSYSASVLFRTTDGGATAGNWSTIAGLPGAPVYALLQHPANASWVYAATGVGLFASENAGATWSTSNEGPANVVVKSLDWNTTGTTSEMLVGTFGRGVWKASVNATYSLGVSKTGTGTGTVTSSPAGIACGSTCSANFDLGTPVTLVATPAGESVFTGWSGACTGTGSCFVTMNASVSVTAAFNQANAITSAASTSFTVSAAGTFTVTATGSPAPLLTVTGALPSGVTFNGATGVLSGTPTLGTVNTYPITFTASNGVAPDANQSFTLSVVKANQAITFGVLANRSLSDAPFTVSATGGGSGNPVTFGSATLLVCTVSGNTVTLLAIGTCTITADQAGNVNYNAAPQTTRSFSVLGPGFALTVGKAGGGTGTVTSSPAGIDCGATCSASFGSGTVVALTQAAASGSSFTGWSGACTGTGACSVTMDSAKSVTAAFSLTTAIPRLANISTRMQVLTGNDVMIGGFVIGGLTPKTVVVRARGPSLVPFGISNALANPKVDLYSGQTVIASNDDFGSAANLAALQASGFAPGNALEGAILATLNPGAYTAIVSGVGNTTGVGLVEIFEVDHPEVPLLNISTRGQVLTGNDVMIGGFVIQGDAPQTVIVRARGPSLIPYGVTNALANPSLQLYSGQTVIASNDDWQTAANASQVQSSGFAPGNPLESAILITLNPGAYTAIVTGAGGTTGVGLVEVFAQ